MVQAGAPKIAFSCLISGLTMVYGRYNELINGGFVMVYKPSYNWGAPPVGCLLMSTMDNCGSGAGAA